MRNNDSLVQALMIQLLYEADTAYGNIFQKSWEIGDSHEWPDRISPIVIGQFSIEVESIDGHCWITVKFAEVSAQTNFDGKRLFHHGVYEPVLSDTQWVDWFNRALCEIAVHNQKAISEVFDVRR